MFRGIFRYLFAEDLPVCCIALVPRSLRRAVVYRYVGFSELNVFFFFFFSVGIRGRVRGFLYAVPDSADGDLKRGLPRATC